MYFGKFEEWVWLLCTPTTPTFALTGPKRCGSPAVCSSNGVLFGSCQDKYLVEVSIQRDRGQEPSNRECPGHIGAVGTYVLYC